MVKKRSWSIFRIMQTIFDTSAVEQTHRFALFLRCCWMEARDIPAGLRQSVTSKLYTICTGILFQPDKRLHFENSFIQNSEFLIYKWGRREGSPLITLVWKIFQLKFPYFVWELTENTSCNLYENRIPWATLLQSLCAGQNLWNLHFR